MAFEILKSNYIANYDVGYVSVWIGTDIFGIILGTLANLILDFLLSTDVCSRHNFIFKFTENEIYYVFY